MKSFVEEIKVKIALKIAWPMIFVMVNSVMSLSQTGMPSILEDAVKHPELSVDISKVAKAKIFLPKRSYRFEEFITLDVGLLVSTNEGIYFPNYLNYRVLIKDKTERPVYLSTIRSDDKLPIFEKQTNTIIKHSLAIVVGCENGVVRDLDKSIDALKDSDDPKEIFERNLFRTAPDVCIDVNEPTQVDISVEIYNQWVVAGNQGVKSKTAVGRIKSNTLSLIIEK